VHTIIRIGLGVYPIMLASGSTLFRKRYKATAAPNEIQFNGVSGLRVHISIKRIGDQTRICAAIG
jgi:hypothetical protein